MAEEVCKIASPLLCHDEASAGSGDDDRSDVDSVLGASSRSESNMSDDEIQSLPADQSSKLSSASSSTLHLDSDGPLYELSSLLAQLPVRRGLSKYYQGKSQSFTSISDATCLQDLAKKITHNKKMKTCKSYTAGLDMNQRSKLLPRPCSKMIAKRPSKSSASCLCSRASSSSLLYNNAELPSLLNKKDVKMQMNSY